MDKNEATGRFWLAIFWLGSLYYIIGPLVYFIFYLDLPKTPSISLILSWLVGVAFVIILNFFIPRAVWVVEATLNVLWAIIIFILIYWPLGKMIF